MNLKCTTHNISANVTKLQLVLHCCLFSPSSHAGKLDHVYNTVLLFILFIFNEKNTVLLGSGNAHMIKPTIVMVVYWSDLKHN